MEALLEEAQSEGDGDVAEAEVRAGLRVGGGRRRTVSAQLLCDVSLSEELPSRKEALDSCSQG